MNSGRFLKDCWDVLYVFLIPFGAGIPGGVVLAHERALAWPVMMVLYFISDVILAFVFEPILQKLIQASRSVSTLGRVATVMKQAVRKSMAPFGHALGPVALVTIAFGVDPMTGRAAAAAAGHGFVSGWAIAIAGDMVYFTLIMVSTLWLNSILGNGTATTIIILVGMFTIPELIKRWRERRSRPT